MIEEIHFCNECFKDLDGYGVLPRQAYQVICEFYAEKRECVCKIGKNGRGNPIVWFLERKKFVVTTEMNDKYLVIKPVGYEKISDTCADFCAFREKHVFINQDEE